MSVVPTLSTLLTWVVYPIWLIAGGIDWFCHRATHIEATSGSTKSWLHLAQFLSLAGFLAAALLPFGPLALVATFVAVLVHTLLSYVDVRFTLGRPHISALEQHVHGFLDVLPWVALALWIVMNLHSDSHNTSAWHMSARGTLTLFGSYAVLAGAPIAVELRRTLRPRSPLSNR